MPQPRYPFSDAYAFPKAPGISAGTQVSAGTYAWLGGNVVPIPGHAASYDFLVAHGLRRIPRFAWLLDCGRNINITHPIPRGVSTAWNSQTASFNWPSTGQACLVLFA